MIKREKPKSLIDSRLRCKLFLEIGTSSINLSLVFLSLSQLSLIDTSSQWLSRKDNQRDWKIAKQLVCKLQKLCSRSRRIRTNPFFTGFKYSWNTKFCRFFSCRMAHTCTKAIEVKRDLNVGNGIFSGSTSGEDNGTRKQRKG